MNTAIQIVPLLFASLALSACSMPPHRTSSAGGSTVLDVPVLRAGAPPALAMLRDPAYLWEATAPPPPRMSQSDMEVWNDPKFRQQFIESYLAETDIEPRITDEERIMMQEVLDHLANERLNEAAALLLPARGAQASAVIDFTLANIYFQQEDIERAAFNYQVAVDKNRKFRRAWRNLGVIRVRQGDYERAAPAFVKVIELGGADAIMFGLLGYSHANTGNYMSAETAYRMAILLDPATMDWQNGLLETLFRQQRFADAAALSSQLIEKDPNNARYWLIQANAYIGLSQPLRAAENYEIVEQMGGSTVASLNMLGDIYVNEELFDLATDTYLRAMAMDENPKSERALRAAKVLAARGAYPELRALIDGLDAFGAGVLTDDERKDMLKLRARMAVAEGAGEEEVHVLQEIVELDPLDGEALILLGQHFGREGDVEQAIFYFERAAAIQDFEAEAKVRHAQLLVGKNRYAEALPLLRRSLTIDPRENVREYMEQVERAAGRSGG